MFKTKKETSLLQEENSQLKSRLKTLFEKAQQNEDHLNHFIESFNSEINIAIEQHEMVNGQHNVLADLVGKIMERFDKVNDISQKSYDKSIGLHEKGQNLIESTVDMVKISGEGRDSVSKVEGLIAKLGEQLHETSVKMNQLNDRSKEIEMIVKVIKEIADQTNLLALNASIEAARAGEHGKGFAVVAEEVRKLAENTAESTHNISVLTQNIQKDIDGSLQSTKMSTGLIEEGIKLSTNTTSTIDYILDVINNVQSEVKDVISTIEEQRDYSNDVMNEIKETRSTFDEANNMIIKHINDASVVDEKLESGIKQIAELSRLGHKAVWEEYEGNE
ncbi:methyl-accepting chemotaxis protein [Cytobacillus eiseniae]|uniref:Methyl-accepting chemotaxis protein n=1 Tax=Cytobacillus eiseniae TaxID=762947 RepID=A0ABS4RKI1_9BACI|nr:methyl-accepting chemotaxis protein [Cytobacillus eiseniae]MBP2243244.1 methyl-accepting chemotaxis protein [Cytobacillus eiseniae]